MVIRTVASLKSFFEKGDKPSEENFSDLIDSTYSGEIGAAIVSAASAGSTGVLQIDSASAVSFLATGTAGIALLSANTPASARTALSAASAGDAIFQIGTIASVRSFIGAASTSAATTASAGIIQIATTAEATAGTEAGKAMTPATHAAASIFTESFESAEQTVGSGSTQVAHGLSTVPTLTQLVLRCLVAEHGYAVGDEIKMSGYIGQELSGTFSRNALIAADATNVRLVQTSTSSHRIQNTSGTNVGITNASWRYVIRAWV